MRADLGRLGGRERRRIDLVRLPDVALRADVRELLRDAIRGEDEIDRSRGDRRARHVGELGGPLVLGEGHAPFRLDRPQPERSVGQASGENDADRPALVGLGERPEEVIDRAISSSLVAARIEAEGAVDEADLRVGGRDVDVVGQDAQPAPHLRHRHARRAAEDFPEHAAAPRVEMLDQHERHPAVRGQVLEQLREGLETAGGRADADDREMGESLLGDGGSGLLRGSTFPLPAAARGGTLLRRLPARHVEPP